jgi:outer membrane protein assembly factor BamD (BamD/ComL family)
MKRYEWMWRVIGPGAVLGVVLALAGVARAVDALEPDARVQELQKTLESVQRDPTQTSQEMMRSLLMLSLDLGRPQAASVIVKNYLSQRREPAPELLFLAARVAEQAGDLRTAVARYKQLLKTAPTATCIPEATERLFYLMVTCFGANEDAFRLMTELGEGGRATLALKRYDAWYLDQAWSRKEIPGMTRRMALILADQMPLELERMMYWDSLDLLLRDLAAARPDQFAALPDARKIAAGLIRGSEARSKRFAFLTAHLHFIASMAGKDAEVLVRDFEPVVAAARAYADAAPAADTVVQMAVAFSGGWERPDDSRRLVCQPQKAAALAYALTKLDNAQRDALFTLIQPGWDLNQRLLVQVGGPHLAQVVGASPDYYRQAPVLRLLPLFQESTNPAVYRASVPALQGIPNVDALAMVALGSGDTLLSCWQRVCQDSWFLESTDELFRLTDQLWLRYRNLSRPEGRLPDDWMDRTLGQFGTETLARSPCFLLDINRAQQFVLSTWRYGAADSQDKSKVFPAVRALDWMPFTPEERATIFTAANNEFRTWSENARTQQRVAKNAMDGATRMLNLATQERDELVNKPKPNLQVLDQRMAEYRKTIEARKADLERLEMVVAQIAPLEELFRQARDPAKTGDLAKAPDEFNRLVARAVVAVREKNQTAFLEAARTLYPMLRDYPDKRTPYGRMVLSFLCRTRQEKFETLDFQMEVLADQLKRGTPEGGNRLVTDVYDQINTGRSWINDVAQKPLRMKLNTVLAAGLRDLIARNQFSETVFNWFLATRRGAGWAELGGNQDLFETIIQRPELLTRPDRVLTWMAWQSECPKLADKFPIGTWFEIPFADECRRRGLVDPRYFRLGGRDSGGAILKATAEVFQKYERLPFGWDDGKVAYRSLQERNQFWELQASAMKAPPAQRDAMLAQIESCYGKTRFDAYANGTVRLSTLTLSPQAERDRYFAQLGKWVAAREQEPVIAPAPSLAPILVFGNRYKMTPAEQEILLRVLRLDCSWSGGGEAAELERLLHEALLPALQHKMLLSLVPRMWMLIRQTTQNADVGRTRLITVAQKLANEGYGDLAASYAAAGLDILSAVLTEDKRLTLAGIRNKVLSSVVVVVAVDRNDKRYPIFQAQASFQIGKQDEAWTLAAENQDHFPDSYKDLDPEFSTWLIGKLTDAGEYAQAKKFADLMTHWMDSMPEVFSPAIRMRLQLAAADISFKQQLYPAARALCEQVLAGSKDSDDTQVRHDANIKIAEIERLTRKYDNAIERLEAMLRSRDTYALVEANYALALVKFDQEEYLAAKEYLENLLTMAPSHMNARILAAKNNIKLKKLEDAIRIKTPLPAEQQVLVPGKPLNISLEDKNLALVGKSTKIEIRVWTKGGDEEVKLLLPFGDSKTKFEGQILTMLGSAVKGDGMLQVLGGDMVYYEFTENFKRINKIADAAAPSGIRVLSDSDLYVSSGQIVTREEMERDALERELRARAYGKKVPPPEENKGKKDEVALSTIRNVQEVKPGNAINVRVYHPGACTSTNRNRIFARASVTSGDRYDRVELLETKPLSAIFEGAIPTVASPPMAMASDSLEGTDPNFVITRTEHPVWQSLADNRRPKFFTVDLNSRAELGTMKIVADEPAHKLKSFRLQTSPDGKNFRLLGAWPENIPAWEGGCRLSVVRFDAGRPPKDLAEIQSYLDIDYLSAGVDKTVLSPRALELNWPEKQGMDGLANLLQVSMNGPRSTYIAHLEGSFYQSVRQRRIFRIATPTPVDRTAKPDPKKPRVSYTMLIDGEISSGVRMLGRGMHKIDIYMVGTPEVDNIFWLESGEIKRRRVVYTRCAPEAFGLPANLPPRELAEAKAAITFTPVAIESTKDKGTFSLKFPRNVNARAVRLTMLDFETDSPAIRKIHLTAADGQAILPTVEDVVEMRKNQRLEVVAGDKISVSYQNPDPLTKAKMFSEAFMGVTYNNGLVSACFVDSVLQSDGSRKPVYADMRRFTPGDTLGIFVKDPDLDISEAEDQTTVEVRVGKGGTPRTVKLMETEKHSGEFFNKIFPVAGAESADKPQEVRVEPGDDIQISYLDAENNDPGIPWERTTIIEQTYYVDPEFVLGTATSRLLTAKELDGANPKMSAAMLAKLAASRGDKAAPDEVFPATRVIEGTMPDLMANDERNTMVLGCAPCGVVTHPTMAISPTSKITIYAQTESGRRKYGQPLKGDFDLDVPGTMSFSTGIGGGGPGSKAPRGYAGVTMGQGVKEAETEDTIKLEQESDLDAGRFGFSVPTRQAPVPEMSLIGYQLRGAGGPDTKEQEMLSAVAVQPDETIYIGYNYTNSLGSNCWLTGQVTLQPDSFFDVMDRRFQEAVTNLHVGEGLSLRVFDPGQKRKFDESERYVTINVATSSSTSNQTLRLEETLARDGTYKGNALFLFSGDEGSTNQANSVRVNYGDIVTFAYLSTVTSQIITHAVEVFKGAPGLVIPFTKQFKDQEIAVQTQFTLAEAYFEMAKKHREMAQEEIARREIGQGKKLLEEAIRDYPNSSLRAQADYLLANLAIEYAMQVADSEKKTQYFLEAVSRFTDIVTGFSDSPYAPKAQFRKALTYEKMGRIDEACEEYVKLSYRYPDNELVAETIARLGQYFLTKGKGYEEEVKAAEDLIKKEKIKIQMLDMYKTAAQVFARLAPRFPDHALAAKTQVLSGQCWMRALDYENAIRVFTAVVDLKKGANELLAEAMYWCGDAHMRRLKAEGKVAVSRKQGNSDSTNAYRMWKRLTWDYPESTWAKYARGRLSEPVFAGMDKE